MKSKSELKAVLLLWKQVYDNEKGDDIVSNEIKLQAKRMMSFIEWVLN